MTHYDEEYEKQIQEASVNIRNEHVTDNVQILTGEDLEDYINKQKSSYINGDLTEEVMLAGIDAHKAHADLVEGFNTSELDDLLEGVTADMFCSEIEPLLKDSKGKAEGARYCFMPDIALSMNHPRYFSLAKELKDLVDLVDNGVTDYAQGLTRQMLGNLAHNDDNFVKNLVGARMDGLKKYKLDNYREEIPIDSLLDATARHLLEILIGNDVDKESGMPHTGHIAANLIMIETQIRLHHG